MKTWAALLSDLRFLGVFIYCKNVIVRPDSGGQGEYIYTYKC